MRAVLVLAPVASSEHLIRLTTTSQLVGQELERLGWLELGQNLAGKYRVTAQVELHGPRARLEA